LIETLRSLPRWCEIALIIIGAFGLFIFSSTYEILEPSPAPYTVGSFVALMQFEIVTGAILLAFLFARGWRLDALGFMRPTWTHVLHALLLFLALLLSSWLLTLAAPFEMLALTVDSGIPIATTIVFSALNAFYEELFVCAYLVAATKSSGLAPAVLLSTIVRLSYHAYQGPLGVMLIVPLALLFAWYFARRGSILPLIGVHFAFDVITLLPYASL
jgi:membrane protease YdiL (CAAX protease family)